jgi:hypothetical protein
MELAGIDMLPAEAGIPVIRRELTAGATRGELVIGSRLGVLLDEWDGSGGLVPTARSADWPMIGEVVGMGVHSGLTVRTLLDPAAQPFLDDHRMDGTALLPGVMGIEAFAELALLPLPGWHVASVEDVEFLAPFKFYRDAPRSVELCAVFRPDGEEIVAECSLSGVRELPGQAVPQSTTHFTATVRLSRTPPAHARAIWAETVGEGVGAHDIYRMYFHGPAFQVLDRAWPEYARAVGLMASGLPTDRVPTSSRTLMAPRLIELCFQTAGVWDLAAKGRFALPMRVDKVSAVGDPAAAEGRLSAVVVLEGDAFDAVVSDEAGNVFVRLEGYRTVELPGSVEPALLGAFEAALP